MGSLACWSSSRLCAWCPCSVYTAPRWLRRHYMKNFLYAARSLQHFFKKNLLCFHFPLNKEWEYKAGSLWKIQFRGSFLNSYKTFYTELLHYYLSPKFHFCYTRRSIMHVYTFQFLTQNPADWPTDSRCLINIYHQWQHCKHPDTLLLK